MSVLRAFLHLPEHAAQVHHPLPVAPLVRLALSLQQQIEEPSFPISLTLKKFVEMQNWVSSCWGFAFIILGTLVIFGKEKKVFVLICIVLIFVIFRWLMCSHIFCCNLRDGDVVRHVSMSMSSPAFRGGGAAETSASWLRTAVRGSSLNPATSLSCFSGLYLRRFVHFGKCG